MSRCYFVEDKLLRSSTKKLSVGGINIRNILTKPWSNLNEESVQQFSNFCLIARFQSLILYFIYYCFIRFAGNQFIDGLPGLALITGIIIKRIIIIGLFSSLDFLITLFLTFRNQFQKDASVVLTAFFFSQFLKFIRFFKFVVIQGDLVG